MKGSEKFTLTQYKCALDFLNANNSLFSAISLQTMMVLHTFRFLQYLQNVHYDCLERWSFLDGFRISKSFSETCCHARLDSIVYSTI